MDSRVGLTWSPAWLPPWPLPTLDGHFHWPMGHFYFLVLAAWPPTLHAHVIMDLAQNPFTFHIKPAPFAFSSMPRSHARCFLSLCCSIISEERVPSQVSENSVWIETQTKDREVSLESSKHYFWLCSPTQGVSSWPFTWIMPCLPLHTHSPQSPQQFFSRAVEATAGSLAQLGGYRVIDGT